MSLDKSLEDIRELRTMLAEIHSDLLNMIDCEDCKKGPCVGRLKPGETGFTPLKALYLCDGWFYLDGCAMLKKSHSGSLLEVSNRDGTFDVDVPTMSVRENIMVKPKDVPVGRKL